MRKPDIGPPPVMALKGPHGEIAEYLGDALYFGLPGIRIRRRAGREIVPASHLGTEWIAIPGTVYTASRLTGRWTTPVETWLDVRCEGITDAQA